MDTPVRDQSGHALWPRYPFPGLRPFRISRSVDESLIFRGRNSHRDDVLERLDNCQFVSVVGPSGCGKSSLVKVGVIPVLRAGLLTRAGYDWQTVEMRPGQDPLGNLADALSRIQPAEGTSSQTRQEIASLLATKRSALWMFTEDALGGEEDDIRPAKARRVLLLIDQFEEIFSSPDSRNVDQFVALISQFFRSPHPQLYILLTMRTDFISQCANFPGLAEILNKTQYITPVLRGQDLRDAIEQPALTYGGLVEKDLVDAIEQDMGAGATYDADHLPLMQHALLWLWQDACSVLPELPHPEGKAGGGPAVVLTLAQYREHGGLHGILNRHADDLLTQAVQGSEKRSAIAEVLFRRLSEKDTSGRYKRSPAPAEEICQLAACTGAELDEIVQPFARRDTSFVEKRPPEAANPLLDISHESLIRQWVRLRAWTDAEAEKLATFRKIVVDAKAWTEQSRAKAFLKTGGQLRVLREWWQLNNPTKLWARRYALVEGRREPLSDCLDDVQAFEAASVRDRDIKVISRRVLSAAVITLVVVAVGSIYLWQERARAKYGFDMARQSVNEELFKHRPARALLLLRKYHELSANSLGVRVRRFLGEAPDAAVQSLMIESLQQLHEERKIQAGGVVYSLSYTPDGKVLLAAAGGQAKVWRFDDGEPVFLGASDGTTYWRTQWSPAGRYASLSSTEQTTALVEVEGKEIKRADLGERAGEARIGLGVFSGDGQWLLTGAQQHPLRLWDMRNRPHLAELGKPSAPSSEQPGGWWIAFSFSGTLAAVPTLTRGLEVFRVSALERKISKSRGFSSEELLAMTSSSADKSTCGIEANAAQVKSVAFNPKQEKMLLASFGCRVVAIDATSGQVLFRLAGVNSEITSVAFSNDGKTIATGADNGSVRLYKTPASLDGQLTRELAVIGRHEGTVFDIRFERDDRRLASGGRDSTIRLWSIDGLLPSAPPSHSFNEVLSIIEKARIDDLDELDESDLCTVGDPSCSDVKPTAPKERP